ncbi:hypothetical protein BY996DRAFT_6470375 [Phakopsora pachyrhizi]|nr:hypothetical protein BY996DRAFT_6470375 [Phakopsora pachyrhizi]
MPNPKEVEVVVGLGVMESNDQEGEEAEQLEISKDEDKAGRSNTQYPHLLQRKRLEDFE